MDTDERNILANKRTEKKIFKHKTNKQLLIFPIIICISIINNFQEKNFIFRE